MAMERDVRHGAPLGSALNVWRCHPAPVVVAVCMEIDADQLARLRMHPANTQEINKDP